MVLYIRRTSLLVPMAVMIRPLTHYDEVNGCQYARYDAGELDAQSDGGRDQIT